MKIQAYRKVSLQGADLKPYRMLRLLAVLALLCLIALGIAPVRSHFTEWRATQQRYNRLAAAAGLPTADVKLQQIWKADLQVVDRCGSCHVAMAGKAEPIGSSTLFRAHPPIPHEPAELGCTLCHGGQGRATRAEAAHGRVRFWDRPLLEGRYAQAACGACHGRLQLPPRPAIEKGAALFAQRDCRRCHLLDGVGRTVSEGAASDLSTVGLKGFPTDWHVKHLTRKRAPADKLPWDSSYGDIPDEEVTQISEFLHTRIGAPRYVLAKATVHELGCRGCHKIFGVGGDEGIELTNEGLKPSSELVLTRMHGTGLAGWLQSKVTDPGYVTPGSAMPNLDLSAEERELATLYLLSLRELPLPATQWTRERVRVEKLKERDFATDGRALFGTFCAGCHNRRGQGRGVPGQGVVFPAVAGPDTLGMVPDTTLQKTIQSGRPGSKMPSWGEKEGGLRPEEVKAVAAYLRSLEPKAPGLEQVRAARIDLAQGQALYRRACASCHGARGEGNVLGTPLAAPDSKRDIEALYRGTAIGKKGTSMGSYGSYQPGELASLLAFIIKLDEVPARRETWRVGMGDARRGSALFASTCQGCHGAKGVGGDAPRIGGPGFLAAAPDGTIAGTIMRGRQGTAMPSFGAPSLSYPTLAAQDALDVVSYLRSLAPKAPTGRLRERKGQ